MRYNITNEGKFRIDEEIIREIDISEAPSNFNNIEFSTDTSKGWIGYNDGVTPNKEIKSTDEIEELIGVSFPTLIERRDARIAELEAEEKARRDAENE